MPNSEQIRSEMDVVGEFYDVLQGFSSPVERFFSVQVRSC
jgi:hypothetical protein